MLRSILAGYTLVLMLASVCFAQQESKEDKLIKTCTRTVKFISFEDNTTWFDHADKGEIPFLVTPAVIEKVKKLQKGAVFDITFDALERYINGKWATVFVITDIRGHHWTAQHLSVNHLLTYKKL